MKSFSKQQAFTLIELSIVLVIIALLVGGAIVGDGMIKNARLMNTVTEQQKFVTAISQFRDKYKQLPGDINNATSFWPAGACADFSVGSRADIAVGTVATCDGTGDGKIASSTADFFESHSAWQQLALSGFLEGNYTGGYEHTGTVTVTPNVRVPNSDYQKDAGWHLYSVGNRNGDGTFFDGNYGHVLYLGKGAFASTSANKALMKVKDIDSLDTKIDDANAATGKLRSGKNAGVFGGACVSASTLNYDLSNTTNLCVPIFLTGIN